MFAASFHFVADVDAVNKKHLQAFNYLFFPSVDTGHNSAADCISDSLPLKTVPTPAEPM